jgi:hypothetical protein
VKADGPVRVSLDHVKSEDWFASVNADAGFFQNFAFGGLLEAFSDFDAAPGYGPAAFGRRLAAADQ